MNKQNIFAKIIKLLKDKKASIEKSRDDKGVDTDADADVNLDLHKGADRESDFSSLSAFSSIKRFSSNTVKQKQLIFAACIAVIIIGAGAIILYKSKPQEETMSKKSGFLPLAGTKSYSKDIEGATDNLSPDKIWRFQSDQQVTKLTTELNNIKQEIDKKLTEDKDTEVKMAITILQEKLTSLEQNLAETKKNNEITETGIQRIQLNLTNKKPEQIKTVDNTIPAGAFAKAVLLSGADASTSLTAASDPSPMLIRITDPGTLPRKFKGDLDDCHVIASGYGDLSSERVHMRLEKLTCVEVLTGEIVQTQVAGYIAGEDGKAGMRGKVVAKENAYLANGFLGGIIGGFSNTLTPQSYVPQISSGGLINGPAAKEKFQSGFGNGMSSSMDRLSKYYIDRAELLQPVIEISAGRLVDVIFTEDAEIGSSNVKKEIAQKRDKARLDAAKNAAKADHYLMEGK